MRTQAYPSLVVTIAGTPVNAVPITGYLTISLTDATDSTFVMTGIPGNVVRSSKPYKRIGRHTSPATCLSTFCCYTGNLGV